MIKPQKTQNGQKKNLDSDPSASSACSAVLRYFDQISEAPDAIPRLRRFILDLVVHGKLVEQDPNDEPAALLLKRIEKEKSRLISVGDLRNQKSQPLNEDQIPFDIPPNWVWSQISQIGIINPRNDADDLAEASFVPMTLISADYKKAHQHEVRSWGEIKTGFTHFAEGDVGLAKITPCFENGKSTIFRHLIGGIGAGTTELHIVRPILIVDNYILIFLKSPHFIETGIPKMTGTAGQKRVPKDYFAFSPFPLPPLAEQHRIVTKVDELMKLCDEMEAAQQKRERRRDRLITASLTKLTDETKNKSILKFSVSSACSSVSRPEHIRQLRQTILNLAVRGKLVPQNPNDEPAMELLKRIEGEKSRLISTGDLRNQKSQPLNRDQIPFDIPSNWVWAQLSQIGIINPRNDADDFLEASFVPMPLIFTDYRKPNQHEIRLWREIKTGFTHFAEGDVGLAKITPCFENGKSTVFRKLTGQIGAGTTELHIVRPIIVFANYILIFLKSPHFIETGIPKMTGTAGQKRVPKHYFAFSPFPLPPLAEQRRILARVDELMALCDELEGKINTTTTNRRQLLKTTIQESLSMS